ncbi:MAG: hypothetical protein HYX69_00075 [Planctomycetia bacterium]|nr:hypothetical protein [Planctomycetia bacterium]
MSKIVFHRELTTDEVAAIAQAFPEASVSKIWPPDKSETIGAIRAK